MTDHSYTGKKIEILEFFSWEEKLQSQTEQIKAKAPTQHHCRKCTKGSHGLTICVILHPFIDLSSNSCTLAEIYILHFSFEVFFHQLQEFVTDMKAVLHVEGVGDVQHVVTFFSSGHVRKVLQEGKFLTWGRKKHLQWFRKENCNMAFLLKMHKNVLCEGKLSFVNNLFLNLQIWRNNRQKHSLEPVFSTQYN